MQELCSHLTLVIQMKLLKLGLLPCKKNCVICLIESPLKMMKNVFVFHLKRFFRSEDILVFVRTF